MTLNNVKTIFLSVLIFSGSIHSALLPAQEELLQFDDSAEITELIEMRVVCHCQQAIKLNDLKYLEQLVIKFKNKCDLREVVLSAACLNNYQALELLIQYNIDPNCASEKTQTTPLHWAAVNNNVPAIVLLVYSRADVNAKDDMNFTALNLLHANLRQTSLMMFYAGADKNVDIKKNRLIRWQNGFTVNTFYNIFQEEMNTIKHSIANSCNLNEDIVDLVMHYIAAKPNLKKLKQIEEPKKSCIIC